MSDEREMLARDICNRSREHSGGRGRHDADRWGPCELHEQAAREVLASPQFASLIAAAEARAWDAGVRHAESCEGGLSCDPRTANPYRAALTAEPVASEAEGGARDCNGYALGSSCGCASSADCPANPDAAT